MNWWAQPTLQKLKNQADVYPGPGVAVAVVRAIDSWVFEVLGPLGFEVETQKDPFDPDIQVCKDLRAE